MEVVYLFTGVNKFAIEEEINKMIKTYQVDELGLAKYDSEETNLDTILDDCETLPFFGEKKIVIINHPLFLSTEKSKLEHNIDRFIKYINNPNNSTILIINACEIKLDKKLRICKLLLEKAKVINCDNLTQEELEIYIEEFLKKYHLTINQDALNELIKRCECDTLRINSELQKLIFYLEDMEVITSEDIELLVSEPIETNIFNLTNYILDGKIDEAIKSYHQLLLFSEDPIVFTSILGKSFHNLYIIKQYQKLNFYEAQLRNILKIHPYQLKILYKLALQTKEENIIKNIHALYEYDRAMKSGKVDKYLGFELLILNMDH